MRRRPYFDTPGIRCLSPVDYRADIYDIAAQQYSLPSVHAINSVTMYGSIAAYLKKKTVTVIVIAATIIIGISRVVLGVHYPTDVMCGWVIGLVIIFVLPLLQRILKNQRILYALLLIITLPGFFYCKSNDFFSAYGMMLGFAVGVELEQKYVNFENTRNLLRSVLRLLFGVGVFYGMNVLLKLPFSKEFLDSGTIMAFIVRSLRYAVITALVFCVYPLIFKVTGKWFKK